ncbi:BolA family protein [Candidatus Hoaglandella endobia]|uniref:Transcriptional regulator BolA n=1 Tax=Candidatus Hoaglandella endobia TaxID=1778263 RepID=A0A143WTI5_9ENTR|nr:BolA family protein [Candidatus Hoaglandella endobia]CUX97028.1 transcriptional regulator BolA [Candidatus Hoaglandella endobia]
MEISTIKEVLIKALALDEAHVSGDDNHVQVIAISAKFAGMSRIQRQQLIYSPLIEYISDNRIHALSIKAYTPDEWLCDRKQNGF